MNKINTHKNEMYLANAQPNLYSIGSLWGFALGETQFLCFAWVVMQIIAFLDTNMLVYPTQNCGIGGLSQRQDPMRMVLRRSGIRALDTRMAISCPHYFMRIFGYMCCLYHSKEYPHLIVQWSPYILPPSLMATSLTRPENKLTDSYLSIFTPQRWPPF